MEEGAGKRRSESGIYTDKSMGEWTASGGVHESVSGGVHESVSAFWMRRVLCRTVRFTKCFSPETAEHAALT